MDIRLAQWDVHATAGSSPEFVMTWVEADGDPYSLVGKDVSVWVGGTVDPDPVDLTGADEYAAVISTNTATVTVTVPDVPTTVLGWVPLRVTLDGQVVLLGTLTPSTVGTPAAAASVDVVVGTIDVAVTLTGAVGGGGGGGATNLTWSASTSKVLSDTGTDATLTAVDGTNPGLMTVAQKTKLDGIETGATADQSASELMTAIQTVDGAASGLDADLLDGQHGAYYATATGLSDHLADTTDAHDASAISVVSTTLVGVGTDVQAVLEELDNAIVAAETSVSDHLADTVDAHDASAISFSPTGSIAATDVQAAIAEVAAEAGGGGATNLSWTAATSVVASDTGTDATLTLVDGSNPGLMSVAMKTKLDGVATGATANSSDATLLARANHTGTQASSTVTVLATDKLLGRATAGAGAVEEIALTAAGRALIDDADATAQQTTLGLGSIATQPATGWFDDANTWTRTGDYTFTIATNAEAWLYKGVKVSYNDGAVDYGVVLSAVHSAGTTTVTLVTNSDYAMAAGSITAPRYSYASDPQGYPGWFNYVPTLTGWSSDPTGTAYRFSIESNTCFLQIRQVTATTSNTTTITITLPIMASSADGDAVWQAAISGTDNSAAMTAAGRAIITTGGSSLTCYKDFNVGAWTASGTKRVTFEMFYEI